MAVPPPPTLTDQGDNTASNGPAKVTWLVGRDGTQDLPSKLF